MSDTLNVRKGLENFSLFMIILTMCGISEYLCERKRCGKLGYNSACWVPESYRKESYDEGDKVEYRCREEDCYSTDSLERQCLPNGTWSGKIPVCYMAIHKTFITKLTILQIEGKQYECLARNSRNGYLEISFNQSFGISTLKLNVIGEKEAKVDVTIKEGNKTIRFCRPIYGSPESSNWLKFDCSSGTGSKGNKITFQLRNGHSKRTDTTAKFNVCNITVYVIGGCRVPDNPYNGFKRKANSSYVITCSQGYRLVGESELQCQNDGAWAPSSPVCEKILNCSCDLLPPVVNGILKCNSTAIKSTAWLECKEGYMPWSQDKIHCSSTGNWTYNESPLCKHIHISDERIKECSSNTNIMSAVVVGAGTAICVLSLALCFVVIKKRWQSTTNTTVFHVGLRDSSSLPDETKEQKYYQGNTYENIIELRNNPSRKTPSTQVETPSHLLMEVDPVYAQPFESSMVQKRGASFNTDKDAYAAHIYAEPVDSQVSSFKSDCNNAAETWLRSGATKFGRKMSLPNRTSSPQSLTLQTSPYSVAICKPVLHSPTLDSVDVTIKKNLETSKVRNSPTELIKNSIYFETRQNYNPDNEIQFRMIENEIYERNSSNT